MARLSSGTRLLLASSVVSMLACDSDVRTPAEISNPRASAELLAHEDGAARIIARELPESVAVGLLAEFTLVIESLSEKAQEVRFTTGDCACLGGDAGVWVPLEAQGSLEVTVQVPGRIGGHIWRWECEVRGGEGVPSKRFEIARRIEQGAPIDVDWGTSAGADVVLFATVAGGEAVPVASLGSSVRRAKVGSGVEERPPVEFFDVPGEDWHYLELAMPHAASPSRRLVSALPTTTLFSSGVEISRWEPDGQEVAAAIPFRTCINPGKMVRVDFGLPLSIGKVRNVWWTALPDVGLFSCDLTDPDNGQFELGFFIVSRVENPYQGIVTLDLELQDGSIVIGDYSIGIGYDASGR